MGSTHFFKFLKTLGARNTDSGRKVKAQDLSSGVTQPFNGKPVENYERNWDAFSGSMWNIEWNIGGG